MGKRNKAILGALPCSHGLSMLILMLFLLSWLCWFDRDEGSSIWHKTEHHYWTFMFIVGGRVELWKGRFSSSRYKLQIKLSLQMFWVSCVKSADHSRICPVSPSPASLSSAIPLPCFAVPDGRHSWRHYCLCAAQMLLALAAAGRIGLTILQL